MPFAAPGAAPVEVEGTLTANGTQVLLRSGIGRDPGAIGTIARRLRSHKGKLRIVLNRAGVRRLVRNGSLGVTVSATATTARRPRRFTVPLILRPR